MNIYDFSVKTRKGDDVLLSDYKGKLILIVNTATGCGFTPQYSELQDIYDKYSSKGLEILDFPCNQFGEQAPGSDEEIYSFCTGRFGITFPQFSKIDVNGENAVPLYKWLTENTSFGGFDEENPLTPILSDVLGKIDPNYAQTSSIKWNFTKFLIDREGNIIERFEPTTPIKTIEEKIAEVI